MKIIVNLVKRAWWFLIGEAHVVMTYHNGDIDIFGIEDESEADDFFKYLEEHEWAAIAMIKNNNGMIINMSSLRKIEVNG